MSKLQAPRGIIDSLNIRNQDYFKLGSIPTAKPKTSFNPADLPCLSWVEIQCHIANTSTTAAFITATATKNCQIFGLELLPEICETFMPYIPVMIVTGANLAS